MTDEKWEQIVEIAKQKFRGVVLRTEPLIVPTPDGPQERGTQDVMEFENHNEQFKLVRENHPKVLQKKEHYSHRAGDTARTEYIYSDTEVTHRIKFYKELDYGDWEEITLDSLGL